MRKGEDVSRFASELNRLCDVRWPGGDRQANVEMAAWVSRETHRDVDRQYIWRIRKGRVLKVDADVRDALCSFFDVPADHFTKTANRSLEEEVELAVEQAGLTVAGLRSEELSEAGRSDLTRLIREIGRVFEVEKSKGAP